MGEYKYRNELSMMIVSSLSRVFCLFQLHFVVEIFCIDPPSIDTTSATSLPSSRHLYLHVYWHTLVDRSLLQLLASNASMTSCSSSSLSSRRLRKRACALFPRTNFSLFRSESEFEQSLRFIVAPEDRFIGSHCWETARWRLFEVVI